MKKKKETERIFYRTTETYKGVTFRCVGSSRAGKLEAKKNWAKSLEKKKAEIDGQVERKEHKDKFSVAIKEWYETYKSHKGYGSGKRSPRTLRTDCDTINQLVKEFGDFRVCDLTAEVIQQYFNRLSSQLSKSSIKKRWNMLKMFFKYIYPAGGNNPMLLCSPIYPEQEIGSEEGTNDKCAYTDIEIERLTEELGQPYNPAGRKSNGIPRGYIYGEILIVILHQFLRVGEAIELRVKDVDLEKGMLSVARQYEGRSHAVMLPKYRSVRKLPIAEFCYPILEKACREKEPDDLLFPAGALKTATAHGGRIVIDNLRDTLYAAEQRLGLEHHTVHDLRHDGISRLVRQGVKPTSIQRWAGHKSLTMTLDLYYRHTGEDDEEDVTLMRGIAV